MHTGFFERWYRWIIAFTVLTLPVGIFGAAMALNRNYNDVEDWLPPNLQETQEYRWFYEHFQGDEILIVSWPGCSLTDPRLPLLADAWKQLCIPGSKELAFRRVLTGRSVYESLTSAPANLGSETAKERMLGWLLGPDRTTTCGILMISPTGILDRSAVLNLVRQEGTKHGLQADEIRIGGPTADSVAIDDESTRSLYQLSLLSIAASFLLAGLSLANLRLVAAVFITAACCECWSLALVYFSGENMDAVLIIMPALVYVLAMCASIHLLNCYREVVSDQGTAGATGQAIRLVWQPTLMASITTAIGLLSLCVSEVTPVCKFGVFSAAGVVLSMLFLFLLLPALLEMFPLQPNDLQRPSQNKNRSRWDIWCSNWAARHWRRLLGTTLVCLIFFGMGATQIRTSIRLSNMFYDSSPVIQEYQWLEKSIGPLVPIDVVLEFSKDCKLTMLERLELSDKVDKAVRQVNHIKGVASASTFVPAIPSAANARGLAQRVVMRKRMERHREKLIEAGYLADSKAGELWLINGRVGAFAPIEYGDLVQQLKCEVVDIVDHQGAANDVRVVVCGGVPLINMVQRRLFDDLANSFGTALLTIGILLAIALRSILAAIILLVPNVLPVALVFGLMGWIGIEVDLGSMLTVSTALGITVDNELHFIAWFRRALNRGLSQRDALSATFEHCGRPMVQTGVICGLGMLVFSLSTFVPTARFGWLMFLLISTAMAGDLLVLSALLASPLGGIFSRRRQANMPQIAQTAKNIVA